MTHPVERCPLCSGVKFDAVLRRDDVPVIQNRLYESLDAARSVALGRLDIVFCRDCGFMFNRCFDQSLVRYDPDYENNQSHSRYFMAHLSRIAERVLHSLNDSDCGQIIEVGCGQGTFLELLHRTAPQRDLVGFDPAWRGESRADSVRIERACFDAKAVEMLDGPIAAVILRHVIEHVPDPVEFLASVRSALPGGWGGRLLIETPCSEWIVDSYAIYDFFYEHCNYFTSTTLAATLRRAGFRLAGMEHVFDGQYLWAEATWDPLPRDVQFGDRAFARRAAQAAFRIAEVEAQQRHLVRAASAQSLAVWGAGAKGVTFASIVDPDGTLIRCLIDINPRKQGGFVAKTGHQVVSVSEAKDLGLGAIIVMNPSYEAEICDLVRDELGPTCKLISLAHAPASQEQTPMDTR